MTYRGQVDDYNTSDTTFIIQQVQQRSRVMVLCFDDITQLRGFALRLYDAGMDGPDYVYLIPDNGVAQSTNISAPPFWVDRGSDPDGRDDQAKAIGLRSFFVRENDYKVTKYDYAKFS